MTRRLRRLEPLDPEGEGRRKSNQTTVRTVDTVREPQRRGKDRNPTLTETSWKCDSSQNPRLRRGATGVVGRGGAADPHGRTERSGVNSIRPTSGRSRGSTFACDGTARFGTCGQDVEAAGLVPRGTSRHTERAGRRAGLQSGLRPDADGTGRLPRHRDGRLRPTTRPGGIRGRPASRSGLSRPGGAIFTRCRPARCTSSR